MILPKYPKAAGSLLMTYNDLKLGTSLDILFMLHDIELKPYVTNSTAVGRP